MDDLGVEVEGLDLRERLPDATIAEIRRLWNENGILLLRGQQITPDHLIAFSRRFGELDLHETLNSAREMTELLGQPIDAGVDVMDEELEQEFMDTMGLEEAETAPLMVATNPRPEPARKNALTVPPRELALPAMMMA